MFAFKNSLTTVLWHPKCSKHVLLLSSLHRNANITKTGKPEIVKFYTKAGVDALDQKVRHYSIYCKIHQWPLTVFEYICFKCILFIPDAKGVARILKKYLKIRQKFLTLMTS